MVTYIAKCRWLDVGLKGGIQRESSYDSHILNAPHGMGRAATCTPLFRTGSRQFLKATAAGKKMESGENRCADSFSPKVLFQSIYVNLPPGSAQVHPAVEECF